uniref:Uncharacterized protein n=1 Tax=Anguilla anguilla TaxID=7936 RepID=A0A0E9WE28_ANGAN
MTSTSTQTWRTASCHAKVISSKTRRTQTTTREVAFSAKRPRALGYINQGSALKREPRHFGSCRCDDRDLTDRQRSRCPFHYCTSWFRWRIGKRMLPKWMRCAFPVCESEDSPV